MHWKLKYEWWNSLESKQIHVYSIWHSSKTGIDADDVHKDVFDNQSDSILSHIFMLTGFQTFNFCSRATQL